MPAPMMTTAALEWFLFPIGTSGHGMDSGMLPIESGGDCTVAKVLGKEVAKSPLQSSRR